MIILVIALVLIGMYITLKSRTNAQIKNTAIQFTQLLIQGKVKEAENLSTGSVKYNLATNPKSLTSYQYLNADAQIETTNAKLAIVHVAATYKADSLNVSFYKLSLVKLGNSYEVYQLDEENPVLPSSNIQQEKPETFLPIFQSYLSGIEKQDYKTAGEVLIGKAKKAHDSTSMYLQKTKLIQNVSDLKADVICTSQKQAVVNFTYTNDKRAISTLVYFYNTIEGWKIYEISQI